MPRKTPQADVPSEADKLRDSMLGTFEEHADEPLPAWALSDGPDDADEAEGDDIDPAEAFARLQHVSAAQSDDEPESEPLCTTCYHAGDLEECADCDRLFCPDHIEDHRCKLEGEVEPDEDIATARARYGTVQDAQSSMLDIVVDDPALGDYIETELRTNAAAKQNRDAKHNRTQLIVNAHKAVINSDEDGEHSGYFIVTASSGKQYRGKAVGGNHDPQERKTKSRGGFKLDDIVIEQIGTMH